MVNLQESRQAENGSVPLWQEIHARLYSTPVDRWWETYAIWARLFDAEGWSHEQVTDAVYRVARRNVLPQFAPQHLQAIREELLAAAREIRELRKRHFDSVDCGTCHSVGWVTELPHLEHVKEGRWHTDMGVYYTQSVCCSCGKGQSIKTAVAALWSKELVREGQFPMDLLEYLRRNPGYREQLEIRKQIYATQRELEGHKKLSTSNENVRQRLTEIMAKIGRRTR